MSKGYDGIVLYPRKRKLKRRWRVEYTVAAVYSDGSESIFQEYVMFYYTKLGARLSAFGDSGMYNTATRKSRAVLYRLQPGEYGEYGGYGE